MHSDIYSSDFVPSLPKVPSYSPSPCYRFSLSFLHSILLPHTYVCWNMRALPPPNACVYRGGSRKVVEDMRRIWPESSQLLLIRRREERSILYNTLHLIQYFFPSPVHRRPCPDYESVVYCRPILRRYSAATSSPVQRPKGKKKYIYIIFKI